MGHSFVFFYDQKKKMNDFFINKTIQAKFDDGLGQRNNYQSIT